MKTWNKLNAEFMAERLKESPDVKKLEDINKQMLKACMKVDMFTLPYSNYAIGVKSLLIGFIIALIILFFV